MGLKEVVITGAYVSGAICIVLLTLSISWLVVWKCVLAKMPFIQELFDLKPTNMTTHAKKSLSFQDRYQAYKRVERDAWGGFLVAQWPASLGVLPSAPH